MARKPQEEPQLKELKKELTELRKTVRTLTDTVNELKSHIVTGAESASENSAVGQYTLFDKGDVSWDRLVKILRKNTDGRTAAELAQEWGKSRSRTSEVLNHLVEEGRLVKFRDGRRIRFRAADS
ncbi:MAG: helix-turn-helix domain-containing protein [Candidatus Thorarchaeota archaeon]